MLLPQQILQYVLTGVALGGVYAIVGFGWAIVHNVTTILNFAQGEFVMLGAMFSVWLIALGLPVVLAFVLAIIITTLIGLLLERFIIRPVKTSNVLTLMVITLAASSVIRGTALLGWGWIPYGLAPFTGGGPVSIFGAKIMSQTLWVIGVVIIIVVFLSIFFDRTFVGKALRACSIDRESARLMGISPERMYLLAFGLAAGLSAGVGIVIVPLTMASYDMGMMTGLMGLIAAIIGGWTISGIFVGGIALGILESLAAGLISSGLKTAIAFLIFIIYLLVRTTMRIGVKR